MTFDAQRYDREVIGPLRGSRGQLPPGDLRDRYAIEPGFTAEQLAQHLRLLREYWRRLAAGPDFDSRAVIGRLLLAADEELMRAVGTAMLDPGWWHRMSPGVSGPEPDTSTSSAAETPGAVRSDVETLPFAEWRAEAQAFVHQQLWQLNEAEGSPIRTAAAAESAEGETASPLAPPAVAIVVELLAVDAEDCLVAVTWLRPEVGEVHVRISETLPEWEGGMVLSAGVASAYGQRLAGSEQQENGKITLKTRVPKGYHLYLPLLMRGSEALVGRWVGFGAAAGVRGLRTSRSGNKAVLSWIWPAGARLAKVEVITDRGTGRTDIDTADYERNNGAILDIGPERTTVRVRAVTVIDGRDTVSAASEITLEASGKTVAYTLTRSALPRLDRSRQVVIGLVSSEDCAAVDLTLVVARGDVMPLSSTHGVVAAKLEGIELVGGVEKRVTVYVPASVDRHRPYWMRCFGPAEGDIVLLDPPVNNMRVK